MKKYNELQIGEKIYSHEEVALLAIAAGIEKKAQRPSLLDLRSQGAFTEYFAILSATNSRQVYAIAESIRQFFKSELNLPPIAVDGMESCTWVLLDFGFLFVHIFQEPTRELYQLELLWNKAQNVAVVEEKYLELYREVKEFTAQNLEDNSLEVGAQT